MNASIAPQTNTTPTPSSAPADGPLGPLPGLALDTSAQLYSSALDRRESYWKRARSKYLTRPIAASLARLKGPLTQYYWNAFHCGDTIAQDAGKTRSKYCGTRPCIICGRIRTARAIGAYLPVLSEWDSPMFVTLTLRTVTADELRPRIGMMLKAIRAVGISMRNTHKLPLKAVRKLECTSRPGELYHPHFHLIVEGRAQAELLKDLWLRRFPDDADPKGQDVRPCDDGSLVELFKYGCKLLTRTKKGARVIPVAELDVIFRAMKGRRVWQPMGFTLPKEVEEEIEGDTLEVEASDAAKRLEETIFWEWCQDAADWVDKETGEVLSEHEPTPFMAGLVDVIDSPELRTEPVSPSPELSTEPVSPSPELSTFAVDASGCIVPAAALAISPPYMPATAPEPPDPTDSTATRTRLATALYASASSTTDAPSCNSPSNSPRGSRHEIRTIPD